MHITFSCETESGRWFVAAAGEGLPRPETTGKSVWARASAFSQVFVTCAGEHASKVCICIRSIYPRSRPPVAVQARSINKALE